MLYTLLLAFAIALIIEGLFPALFPNKWQTYVLKLSKESPSTIRITGTIIILIGSLIIWSIN